MTMKKIGQDEFRGIRIENTSIVHKVRKEGYLGVMFNKSDFMDAVVWAANLVYEYRDYFKSHMREVVVSEEDLPFLKEDLENAHCILISYYKMKKNLVLAEEFKMSLLTVARFQKVKTEDVGIMAEWNEFLQMVQEKEESGDFAGYDIGNLKGSEQTYERYARMVADEVDRYRDVIAKL